MRTHYIKAPKEVLDVIANHPFSKRTRLADVIVVGALANRLMVNFYIRFFKPKEPTQVFNSIEKAENYNFQKWDN
ncbi:MAG: hypothetical protein JKY42_02100 [Flavobacteriales bacterium]|nr:hypothetical protein [Flavobacteriales bacterium]